MILNKVEICGVNTSRLPLLTAEEKNTLFERIKKGDKEARELYIKGNLRLVLSVIKRFSSSSENADDLFQIGCIGLCKAAYSDKGGCFSTYAYRLIWNEICTALIYANRRAAKECELLPEVLGKEDSLDEHHELSMILDRLEANASEAMAKGIRAIRLSAEGYSHAEIGSILGESDKCVAARISRTRKYLRSHPDLAAF